MPEPQIQYVRSADGTSIAFFEMGDGTPLILSPNIWDHLVARWQGEDREALLQLVRDGFRVIRYDMRGMGMSGGATDFSLEAQMADIEAVRQHVGFEQSRWRGSCTHHLRVSHTPRGIRSDSRTWSSSFHSRMAKSGTKLCRP
jgi:pimeloyl-ACP methyl ester carboxylesterase